MPKSLVRRSSQVLVVMRCLGVFALMAYGTAQAAVTPVVNPRDFGAKADGITKDTAALQKAFDSCMGPAQCVVDLEGGTFVSGPLVLHGHLTVRIGANAVLLGSPDHADYPPVTEMRAPTLQPLLSAKDAEDITIEGGGTIDGNGGSWWAGARAAHDHGILGEGYKRPKLIVISHSRHIRIHHIALRNSPMWQLVSYYCDDVVVEDVTITAEPHSPNTDAIDPFSTTNMQIRRVTADVGDDDIAIKSGLIGSPGPDAPSKNITVEDCTFLHGHGLSIGSELSGGAQNIVIRNIRFVGTDNGLRIKANRDRGADVSGIQATHIEMRDVKTAILISEYYPKVMPETGELPAAVTRLTPFFHDIKIEDLRAVSSKVAGYVLGLPESPVKGVVLRNVSIYAQQGLTVGNAQVTATGLHIQAMHGDPLMRLDGAKITLNK